jgi:hypothetical protein
MNPEKQGIFARIPFRKLQASFQKPQTNEGFTEVIDVDFEVSLCPFDLAVLGLGFIEYSGLEVTSSLRFGEGIGFRL